MRKPSFAAVVILFSVSCNRSPAVLTLGAACETSAGDCDAGSLCIDARCVKPECMANDDCAADKICSSQFQCQARDPNASGSAFSVTDIFGNVEVAGSHYVGDGVVVTGTGLDGVASAVFLASAGAASTLGVRSAADTSAELVLPAGIDSASEAGLSGTLRLTHLLQGSVTREVTFLRGLTGPTGATGVAEDALDINTADARYERKGQPHTLLVSPSDFVPRSSSSSETATWQLSGALLFRASAARVGQMVAHLALPDGATLGAVTCRICDLNEATAGQDDDAHVFITVQQMRRNASSGAMSNTCKWLNGGPSVGAALGSKMQDVTLVDYPTPCVGGGLVANSTVSGAQWFEMTVSSVDEGSSSMVALDANDAALVYCSVAYTAAP